jgi:UDP-N-acetylglucosamine--N-acetylmuramyl-(pentapeptide) pyrophosphoryl-undecaprenol N-acetylglucosamine transferase
MHIVFAGGMAPGQWLAGIAVAHQLHATNRRARISFLGSGNDFESRNATLAGFQYRSLTDANPRWTWRILSDDLVAHRTARRFIKRERPNCLVALGGPASIAAMRAALGVGVPTIIHEFDALPDAVSESYARDASVVSAGFGAVGVQIHSDAVVRVVGNPIRASFSQVFQRRQKAHHSPEVDRRAERQIVVLAGAAGNGELINEWAPKALYKVRDHLFGWKILHQSGNRDLAHTRELYGKLGLAAEVTASIPDMPRVLLRSDIAIARPGAVTLSELAAAMLPAIVVPSDEDAGGRQVANAAAFSTAGACRVVSPVDGGRRLDDRLGDALADLLADGIVRRELSAAIGGLARPAAARHLALTILDVVGTSHLQNVA